MTVILSLRDLADAAACTGQLRQFKLCFGKQVVATVTTAVAHADDFDWYWAASAFLVGVGTDIWVAEMESWSWEPRRPNPEAETSHDAYPVYRRHMAAAFAKAFLAQGGVRRGRRPRGFMR